MFILEYREQRKEKMYYDFLVTKPACANKTLRQTLLSSKSIFYISLMLINI